MITSRDLEVVDFLKTYKLASTDTIAEILFPSISACQKRLKVLYDSKQINRVRDSICSRYVYFAKKPKQYKHGLLVTDFYRELSKQSEVINFKIEPLYDYIRPDAVFGYRINNKGYLGLLEVEISHKGLDVNKYDRFFSSMDYKKYFPVIPQLFVVSDIIKENDLGIKFIKTSLSNLSLV